MQAYDTKMHISYVSPPKKVLCAPQRCKFLIRSLLIDNIRERELHFTLCFCKAKELCKIILYSFEVIETLELVCISKGSLEYQKHVHLNQ